MKSQILRLKMTLFLRLLPLAVMLIGPDSLTSGAPNPRELDYNTPEAVLRDVLLHQSPALPSTPEKRPYEGQPEYPDPITLPTDEESYGTLMEALRHGSLKNVHSTFPEIDSRGFYENVFGEGFSNFSPWKRSKRKSTQESDAIDTSDDSSDNGKAGMREKRSPSGIDARGFHENIFEDFGGFSPVKKSVPIRLHPPRYQKRQSDAYYEAYYPEHFATGKRGSKVNQDQYADDYLNTYVPYNTFNSFGKRFSKEITKRPTQDQYAEDYLNTYVPYNSFNQFGKRLSTDANPYEYFTNKRLTTSDNPYDYFQKRLTTGNGPYDRFDDVYLQPYHYVFKRSADGKRLPGDETDDQSTELGKNDENYEGKGSNKTVGSVTRTKRSVENNNKTEEKEEKEKEEKKRRPVMDSSGFYGDTFSNGFGDFYTMKKKENSKTHDEDKAKRRPEMDSSGFYGDTFNSGFGDFYTMKRKMDENTKKRKPEMDSSGFYGDTFNSGFGDFYTMKRNLKKRRPEMDSSGFYGDTFNSGFGDFYTMKRALEKRRPEMDSSGFYGDTFNSGFGDFYTMKRALDKRRPEMDSSGFYGDTFNSGFGDFYTMKRALGKRRPEMDSSGFYGDTFSGGFGDFHTMKKDGKGHKTKWSKIESLLGRLEHKRRPELDSRGFYGDTFSSGFGNFNTMKKKDVKTPEPKTAKEPETGSKRNKRSVDDNSSETESDRHLFPDHNSSLFSKEHSTMSENSSSAETNLDEKQGNKVSRIRRHIIPIRRSSRRDSSGNYGDTFSDRFEGLHPVKRSEMNARGFNDDIFTNGFGSIFETMR